MRLIDADALLEQYGLKDATKYGNKDAEQQAHSYSTLMLYEIADMIDDMPTVTEADIRAKAIEEFAKALLVNEVVDKSVVRRVAEQLKGEHGRTLNRCDTCIHYITDKVPPVCYFCCKGMEDNYKAKEET